MEMACAWYMVIDESLAGYADAGPRYRRFDGFLSIGVRFTAGVQRWLPIVLIALWVPNKTN